MGGTIVLPWPETLIVFGVHVKIFTALFGVAGVLLGHLMAPLAGEPLGWRRQAAVIAAGVLVSISITIATGQRPLIVMSWSIGIGFAGIALFQIAGARTASAARSLGGAAIDELAARIAARRDQP